MSLILINQLYLLSKLFLINRTERTDQSHIQVFLFMSLWLILLTVFAVYIILSYIFLRKPNWLHKRRRPAFIARNIGHRGGKLIKNFDFFEPSAFLKNKSPGKDSLIQWEYIKHWSPYS